MAGIQGYNAEEVLQEIIYIAHHENDVAQFGKNVASVLLQHCYIDEAVYEILTGEISDF